MFSLRSYRVDYNDITVTNVDRKNAYFALTYSEDIKKGELINKII
jgi:hypothetical protein